VNNIKLSTNYLVQSNTTRQYLSSIAKCFDSTKHRQILLYKNLKKNHYTCSMHYVLVRSRYFTNI